MNINNIIKEIESIDANVYDRFSSRRRAMKSFAGLGSKVALSAIPLALGSMFKKAYGQSSAIADVLQFALTLEYLECTFYTKACSVSGLIPAEDMEGIKSIQRHEHEHVEFLKSAISGMGITPIKSPEFDYTAKGNFPDVFTNYDTFLAVSQAFEDTGVRAYKGQAGNLMDNGDVLTAALNIHSVEARHASHVREIRKRRGADVKPWITLNQSGIPSAAVAPIYAGEENTQQAGVEIKNINGLSISAEAASESFDEPLTKEQVTAIVTPFFA